jgi:hypothetical protein
MILLTKTFYHNKPSPSISLKVITKPLCFYIAAIFKTIFTMALVIHLEHEMEEMVYLKTDSSQYPRIITDFKWNGGDLLYEVSCGTMSSWHRGYEISKTKDILLKINEA